MLTMDDRWLEARAWLTDWAAGNPIGDLNPASADASFRRYFRLIRPNLPSLILMDAPPRQESVEAFVDLAVKLRNCGVHTPAIHAICERRGFVLMEDLGQTWLLERLNQATMQHTTAEWVDAAFRVLFTLQSNAGSVAAGLPEYDESVLKREMRLLPEWFLTQHLGLTLSNEEQSLIEALFAQVAEEILSQPTGFVHRDFHSRNLMVLSDGELGVLDFQDALKGPLSYDWVSVLKDCYIRWPRAWVLEWIAHYHAQWQRAGLLESVTSERWIEAIDWMGLQRHLKVLGIFARLNYRDGKAQYLDDLPRVFAYVDEVLALYPSLSRYHEWWQHRVTPSFSRRHL